MTVKKVTFFKLTWSTRLSFKINTRIILLHRKNEKVTSDMLSPYCRQLNENLNLADAPVTKLVQNLE